MHGFPLTYGDKPYLFGTDIFGHTWTRHDAAEPYASYGQEY
jgi:hypothetical protein